MKTKKRESCAMCGRDIDIILGGERTERLCLSCFLANYPVLKPLARVM